MMASLRSYSNLVVLQHSVFALPFALSAYLIAEVRNQHSPMNVNISSVFGLKSFTLVILCVVAARTAAMAFNRFLDAKIDAQNPRTTVREIPQGVVSRNSALVLTFVSSALFFCGAALLGKHCLRPAPFVLFVLLGYSYTKRFTPFSHFVLGLALALAPGGAWWVLRPQVELFPLVLMLGVTLWVAGFDILYSCQDVEFDRRANLHSVPQAVGVATALKVSRWVHASAFLCFAALGLWPELSPLYFGGGVVLGILLIAQHRTVTPTDLSRINRAFFTFNGVMSVFYFVLIYFVRR